MVEVVTTVVSPSLLPREKAFGLVLNSDAFLELGVIVSTPVTSVHRNEECVELFLGMVPWFVSVRRNTSVIVKE